MVYLSYIFAYEVRGIETRGNSRAKAMGENREAQMLSIEVLLTNALEEICDAANIARDAGRDDLSKAIIELSGHVRAVLTRTRASTNGDEGNATN